MERFFFLWNWNILENFHENFIETFHSSNSFMLCGVTFYFTLVKEHHRWSIHTTATSTGMNHLVLPNTLNTQAFCTLLCLDIWFFQYFYFKSAACIQSNFTTPTLRFFQTTKTTSIRTRESSTLGILQLGVCELKKGVAEFVLQKLANLAYMWFWRINIWKSNPQVTQFTALLASLIHCHCVGLITKQTVTQINNVFPRTEDSTQSIPRTQAMYFSPWCHTYFS